MVCGGTVQTCYCMYPSNTWNQQNHNMNKINKPILHSDTPQSLPNYLKEFAVSENSTRCIEVIDGPAMFSCVGPFGKGCGGFHNVLCGEEATVLTCGKCSANICRHCRMNDININGENLLLSLPCYGMQLIIPENEGHSTGGNETKTIDEMRTKLLTAGYEIDKGAMSYRYPMYSTKDFTMVRG